MNGFSTTAIVWQRSGLLGGSFFHYLFVFLSPLKLSTNPVPWVYKSPVTILVYFFLLSLLPQSLVAHTIEKNNGSNQQNHDEIRIVMSGAFVSESGIGVYDEIANYLQNKLNHKVSFITGFSYSTINSMFDSGMADIGFICGLPYIMKASDPQPSIELFLAPVMKSRKYKDKPIYYSYVIVHKDSKFESFSDLKGSTFTFNDEISNSGYNMPRAKLIEMGETSGFFGSIVRSGSHEESIRMVALGKADVSAVDSLVYDYDLAKNPKYVQQTRILEVLGPAGIPPVVISTRIPPSQRQQISDILLGMKNDPVGAKILEQALVDRFIVVDDSNYDGIRKMRKQAQDSGYQVIR